jgi:cobalt-zinc-cadmium efflux system outer membrane protein
MGTASPRVPTEISEPGRRAGRPGRRHGIAPPTRLAATARPNYGTLDLPGRSAAGPSGGLTLDAALERLLRENLDLRARAYELSMARADELTASLRANPIFYADSQLVPYGAYSRARPGGQTQYDVNVSCPVDLSGKRRARIAVACRAQRVLEAQFQDAVRQQIDNLYTAWVDVLAAREDVRYSRAGLAGLETLAARLQRQRAQGLVSPVDVLRVQLQRDNAALASIETEEAYRTAKRELVPLLRLAPTEAEAIEPSGQLRDRGTDPPGIVELLRIAVAERPDLVAYRLGVGRAEADVELARAERFQDVYVLYQPYTFQDNAPFGSKSVHSWALGVTVPLPVSNRNQGNIERARLNVAQTRTELEALELRIAGEVRQAEREYAFSLRAVDEIERTLLPTARQVLSETNELLGLGEVGFVEFLNARREHNEIVRQYRDAAIRHRRAALALNTAVGRRILP